MPLLPIQPGDEVQPPGVAAQKYPLDQPGAVQGPVHDQRRPVRLLADLDPGPALQRHRQLFIHAAQLPGVVAGVHVLEQEEPVAVPGKKFPGLSRLADAGQLAGIVDPADEVVVSQLIAAALLRREPPGGSPLSRTAFRADDREALGGYPVAPEGPLPAQVVVDGHPLPRPAQHLLQQLSALGADGLQLRLRPLVDPGNGGARGDVVELVEQQELPELVQPLLPGCL